MALRLRGHKQRNQAFHSKDATQMHETAGYQEAKYCVNSLHTSQVAHQAGAYLWSLYHEVNRSISTPPWIRGYPIAGLPS